MKATLALALQLAPGEGSAHALIDALHHLCHSGVAHSLDCRDVPQHNPGLLNNSNGSLSLKFPLFIVTEPRIQGQ